jgi:hypothetical protein
VRLKTKKVVHFCTGSFWLQCQELFALFLSPVQFINRAFFFLLVCGLFLLLSFTSPVSVFPIFVSLWYSPELTEGPVTLLSFFALHDLLKTPTKREKWLAILELHHTRRGSTSFLALRRGPPPPHYLVPVRTALQSQSQ